MYGLVWTAFLPLYGFPYKDKIVSQPFLKMGIPTTAHIFVYYDGALNMSLVGQSNGCICPDDCLLSGQLSSSRDEGRLETRELVCKKRIRTIISIYIINLDNGLVPNRNKVWHIIN